jgi:starvation-inducible DNA-binding protein
MTHQLSQDHHPTLRHVERETVGVGLQAVLETLVALALTGKHAHWNVVGPHFRTLHLQLDEMVDAWRAAADEVAERAVALGHAPDGRSPTVAARSTLSELPAGPLRDDDVIATFTRLLTDAVALVRDHTASLEDVDTVTADFLHGVTATLEQQLWMVRVQAP